MIIRLHLNKMLNHYACERVVKALKVLGVSSIPKHGDLFEDLFNNHEEMSYATLYKYYAAYIAYSSNNQKLIDELERRLSKDPRASLYGTRAFYFEASSCLESGYIKGMSFIMRQVTRFNIDHYKSLRVKVGNLLRYNYNHISDESFEVMVFYKLIEGRQAQKQDMILGGNLLLLIRSINGLITDVIEHIIKLMLTISIAN